MKNKYGLRNGQFFMGYKYSNYNIMCDYEDGTLLYNVISEALIKLDKNGVEYYNTVLDNYIKKDERFALLLANGFIVDSDLDELAFTRLSNRNICYNNDSLNVTIAPTMNCNMRCTYCFEKHVQGNMNTEIQEKVISYLIDYLEKNHLPCFKVHWFGGEPLLCWDIIKNMSKKFISFCNDKKIEYAATIITNGTLLSKEIINEMVEFKIKSAQITIDGIKAIHDTRRIFVDGSGTYDTIINKLLLFEHKNIKVNVRVNIDENNPASYEEVLKQISELNLDNITVYPAMTESFPNNKMVEDTIDREVFAKTLYVEHKRNHFSWPPKYIACLAQAKNAFAIDQNGFLYKCWNQIGETNYAYANVNESYPYNIQNLMMYMDEDITRDVECSQCKLLPLCYGGCTYLRNSQQGKPCIPEKYCINEMIILKYKYVKEGI